MNQPKQGLIVLLLAVGALFGIGAAMWLGRKSPLGQQVSQDITRAVKAARNTTRGTSTKGAGRGKGEDLEDPLFI